MPLIKNQHWIFRVPEFIKIQVLFCQIIATVGIFIFTTINNKNWYILVIQFILISYHLYLLARYTKFYKSKIIKKSKLSTRKKQNFKIISANVYQYNKNFSQFKDCIKKEKPDIFVTIESNKDWELAIRELEIEYPYSQKITLENTYGMHLYAKIPFQKINTHYFIANDIPSIEAHFKTKNTEDFVVFCVHPPPPSPTEEKTSKERDGDLMCIAKHIKKIKKPILVIGDFNTVPWSNISKLFRKNTGLIDARSGRGILASYHAKYWFFRIPLDLVFHNNTILIKKLRVLKHIGSDHFPICCTFCVDSFNRKKNQKNITKKEKEETYNLIKKGKKETSNNRIN
ncbi:endonuclease/exonuclease/phosphatase family protein [Tenacibaculum aestuariivivum]|uniref:endonuclease/exonuclease/phosphatase family protein n=1 Tax=Tenacibaculum aestuariivivum TaxID=2006131 RepID=UPI003AB13495